MTINLCGDCRHYRLRMSEAPCASCSISDSKWEPVMFDKLFTKKPDLSALDHKPGERHPLDKPGERHPLDKLPLYRPLDQVPPRRLNDATPEEWDAASAAVRQQPAPTPTGAPAAWSLVMRDMADRDVFGAQKYGTRLQPGNGRDALADAYQEALDLAVYLRTAIYERDGK